MLKAFTSVLPLLLLFLGSPSALVTPETEHEFGNFVAKHGKIYDDQQYKHRLEVFSENFDKIQKHNSQNLDWKLEVNPWTDHTWEEFKNARLGLVQNPSSSKSSHTPHTSTPATSWDWRQHGAVNPIVNQQQCGSCWAFSAVASVEGAYAIKTGKLFSLSKQQLVDCSGPEGNYGCNGGMPDNAFEYVIRNGLCNSSEYLYTGTKGKCKTCHTSVKISSYKDVKPLDASALVQAVAQQPVSVAIEADQNIFQFYSSGVITGSCGTNLDHAVVVVGYGTEAGKDYWIVRNSWGTSWGEQGYVRIARGKNVCGIESVPSYPVV